METETEKLRAILESHRLWLSGTGGSRADLHGADLRGVDLCMANLRGADLYRANLCRANLNMANLRGADLFGANLCEANLRWANLQGVRVNWQSHVLVAEILRQAAGQDRTKREVAGLILVSTDWCWQDFASRCGEDPRWTWALTELRQWVREGDGAPELLMASWEGGGRSA